MRRIVVTFWCHVISLIAGKRAQIHRILQHANLCNLFFAFNIRDLRAHQQIRIVRRNFFLLNAFRQFTVEIWPCQCIDRFSLVTLCATFPQHVNTISVAVVDANRKSALSRWLRDQIRLRFEVQKPLRIDHFHIWRRKMVLRQQHAARVEKLIDRCLCFCSHLRVRDVIHIFLKSNQRVSKIIGFFPHFRSLFVHKTSTFHLSVSSLLFMFLLYCPISSLKNNSKSRP